MKEILQTIIKALVQEKEAIAIEEKQTEKEIIYTIKVSQKDMGQVIGKQGKVAKSIRTIMKSVAGKEGKKINVEFLD